MKSTPRKQTRKKENIYGMLVPAQWDRHFCVTDVLVACAGERELRIANLDSLAVVKTLIRSQVKLYGWVEVVDGTEAIHIERLTCMVNGQEQVHVVNTEDDPAVAKP